MVKSREPTLFQKLVSSDIKRDRHRLLHTFKFMAQNNFFEDWPDKPLEYPSVKVNQVELEIDDIAAEDLDDDLPDAETAKDMSVDLKENGDEQGPVSSDEEAGSKDGDESDEEEGEVVEEDDDAGECDASEEEEFSA
jgi:cleavage and polyadenylation specificity factor subunit 4